MLAWAAAHGLRVSPGAQLFLQFGSQAVGDCCTARGYLSAFAAVGATVLQPAGGACANCGPGSSTQPGQVTVSAVNRNSPGRSGPGAVWLARPATVAASAIAGHLLSFADLQAQVSKAGLGLRWCPHLTNRLWGAHPDDPGAPFLPPRPWP